MGKRRSRWASVGPVLAILALLVVAWIDSVLAQLIVPRIAAPVLLVLVVILPALVKSPVLAIGLHPFDAATGPLIRANLYSTLAGFVIAFFVEAFYYPNNLVALYRAYPRALATNTILWFAAAIIIEYFVILKWRKRAGAPVGFRRLASVIILANCVSFAVMVPLQHVACRPKIDNIRTHAADCSWAGRPLTEIYFVDGPTGALCSIMSDGSNRRVLAPGKVATFQVCPEAKLVLYCDDKKRTYLRSFDGELNALCLKGVELYAGEITFSPDGRWVAWRGADKESGSRIVEFYDVAGQRTLKKEINASVVAWSASPETLYLTGLDGIQSLTITPDGAFSVEPFTTGTPQFARIYTVLPNSADEANGIEAIVHPGKRISSFEVRNADKRILFECTGGDPLGFFPRWAFFNPCILPATNEVIFADRTNIYLLNVPESKLGWITRGKEFVIANDQYLVSAAWAEEMERLDRLSTSKPRGQP